MITAEATDCFRPPEAGLHPASLCSCRGLLILRPQFLQRANIYTYISVILLFIIVFVFTSNILINICLSKKL